jgi:hypothetical protein
MALVASPGQPVQLSSPAVLAPSDDRPAVSAPAAPARIGHPLAALRRWESSAALLLISTVYSLIQGATQNIIGIDGYYHIKVALLMREQGWRLLAPLDFPWLQMTILGPGRYTDHHFLFHVLQSPFTLTDPRVGAKMAAVLFAVIGLYTTYLFLARFGVRYPLLWIGVLMACAPIYLWRQSMARTQSLSVLLIVIGLWLLFAGRLRWLVVVGFLMAWLFNGFFFVLGAPLAAVVVSVAHLVARRWWLRDDLSPPAPHSGAESGEPDLYLPFPSQGGGVGGGGLPSLKFALTALMWTLVGLGLGLLLHPYFPRNVEFAFFHLLPKAVPSEQADITVGSEWYPYSLSNYILKAGPSTVLTLLGLAPIGVALWRRRWPDWRALVLAILALGFLAMAARSQRIMEYFPAFAAIFCAWSWSHVPDARAWLDQRLRPRLLDSRARIVGRLRPAVPWLVALVVAPFIVVSTLTASKQANEGLSWTTYREGALWLANHTPAGSRVFTTGWDDFPHMFYWNTHNVYLTGLDPTYMSLEDPEAFQLWRSIAQGRVQNPGRQIRERFGSPYVLTDMEHKRFIQVAATDPDLEEVLRTRTVVVYRVRGG